MHEFANSRDYMTILRSLGGRPRTLNELRSELTLTPPKTKGEIRPRGRGPLDLNAQQMDSKLRVLRRAGIVGRDKVKGRWTYRLARDFTEINRRFVRELHLNFLREERGLPFDFGHRSIAVHGVPKDSPLVAPDLTTRTSSHHDNDKGLPKIGGELRVAVDKLAEALYGHNKGYQELTAKLARLEKEKAERTRDLYDTERRRDPSLSRRPPRVVLDDAEMDEIDHAQKASWERIDSDGRLKAIEAEIWRLREERSKFAFGVSIVWPMDYFMVGPTRVRTVFPRMDPERR